MAVTTGAFAFTPIVTTGAFSYVPSIEDSSFNSTTGRTTFTASGTFTTPSTKVQLNKRGKIDVYLTACAAGGSGGIFDTAPMTPGSQVRFGAGGQGGDYCHRYKIELRPGEKVAVTIPTSAGGSFVFGSYLTLSGGVTGQDGLEMGPGPSDQAPNSGAIISGSLVNENAVQEGSKGGRGGTTNTFGSGSAGAQGVDGMQNNINGTLGTLGGKGNGGGAVNSGGAGAGLFSDAVANADATANGGGGGSASPSATRYLGGSGKCYVEWKVLT